MLDCVLAARGAMSGVVGCFCVGLIVLGGKGLGVWAVALVGWRAPVGCSVCWDDSVPRRLVLLGVLIAGVWLGMSVFVVGCGVFGCIVV